MSRLGKKPIPVLKGVDIKITENEVVVKGPKGELKRILHPHVFMEKASLDGADAIQVSVKNPEEKQDKAYWGLFVSLLKNMMQGVVAGYEKKLEINGVGFKAVASGQKLTLNVGFSHPVIFEVPQGIKCTVENNIITVSGIDKELVGEIAARIRKIKKPEPYLGKGIKYIDEVLRRKAGKTAKSA